MRTTTTITLGLLLISACGGGSAGTQPDDMSAEEHRAAADAENQEAEGHGHEEGGATPIRGASITFDLDQYDPREAHTAAVAEHRQLASQHRQAAETLESYEEAECASFPGETRALCPLLGQVAAVDDIPGGAKLTFSDGVNVAAAKAHVRCHSAFARSEGREGMDHCPMYVEGVVVEDDGEGVSLTSDVEGADAEIRRRARAHMSH